MAISSQAAAPSRVVLQISNWQHAGLWRPSIVQPVFTILELRLVLKKLGRLALDDRRALE
jgi:hypothetical protein